MVVEEDRNVLAGVLTLNASKKEGMPPQMVGRTRLASSKILSIEPDHRPICLCVVLFFFVFVVVFS